MTSGLAARTSKSTVSPEHQNRQTAGEKPHAAANRMRTARSKTQTIEGNHAPQLRRTKHRNSARTKRDSSAHSTKSEQSTRRYQLVRVRTLHPFVGHQWITLTSH